MKKLTESARVLLSSILLAAIYATVLVFTFHSCVAHAATPTYLGKGGLFICQTSRPVNNTAQIWIRCSDGAVIYTNASNVDAVVSTGSAGSFSTVYSTTTPSLNIVTEVTAGGPLALVGGSSQGSIFSAADHSSNTLFSLSDNASLVLRSDVAASGSATNLIVNTPASYATGDSILTLEASGTPLVTFEHTGGNAFSMISHVSFLNLNLAAGDGIYVTPNLVTMKTGGANELYVTTAGGGIGSYAGTYVSGTGIFAYGDGNQVSGALGNNWKAVHSYHYTSAGNPNCTPLTNAGSGASCSIAHSSDTAWIVTVVAGTGSSPGDIVSIGPSLSYEHTPVCTVAGTSTTAAALQPFYDVGASSISSMVLGSAVAVSGTTSYSMVCISPNS